jgi:hypothetical protein
MLTNVLSENSNWKLIPFRGIKGGRWTWWLMPVILDILEVEIRRIKV